MFQLLNVLCFVAPSANLTVNPVLVLLLCALSSNRPATSLKQSGWSSPIMFQTLSSTPSRWRKKAGKGGTQTLMDWTVWDPWTKPNPCKKNNMYFSWSLGNNSVPYISLISCRSRKPFNFVGDSPKDYKHLDQVALKTKIKNKIS